MAQVEVSDFHEGLFVEDVHGLRFYALNILKRNVGKTKEDVAAELCRQLGVVKCPSNVVGEAVGESLAANPVDSTHDYQVAKASPKGRKTQHHVKHPQNSSEAAIGTVATLCNNGSPRSITSNDVPVASLRRREMLDADKAAVPSRMSVVQLLSYPPKTKYCSQMLVSSLLYNVGFDAVKPRYVEIPEIPADERMKENVTAYLKQLEVEGVEYLPGKCARHGKNGKCQGHPTETKA